MEKWSLKNKKAVITGGSKGIGKAVVAEFLELGAAVAFTARDAREVELVTSYFSKQGHTVHGFVADVTSKEHRHTLFNWIKEQWGKLDILVNNAGINIRKPSNEYVVEEYRKVIEIDLIAPFELSQELYPLLKNSGNAAIINVASVAGIMDARTGAPYGMSKSGLIQLTRNLASEWSGSGIRVNAVSPWFTQTPATAAVLSDPEKSHRIISRTPLGRVASGEEIAAAIAFLAMDKASFITGHNLVVDGGATSSIL